MANTAVFPELGSLGGTVSRILSSGTGSGATRGGAHGSRQPRTTGGPARPVPIGSCAAGSLREDGRSAFPTHSTAFVGPVAEGLRCANSLAAGGSKERRRRGDRTADKRSPGSGPHFAQPTRPAFDLGRWRPKGQGSNSITQRRQRHKRVMSFWREEEAFKRDWRTRGGQRLKPTAAISSSTNGCPVPGDSAHWATVHSSSAACQPKTCFRRSRSTHRSLVSPCIGRAPSRRVGPHRPRRAPNSLSTYSRVPKTAPSAKYRTRS